MKTKIRLFETLDKNVWGCYTVRMNEYPLSQLYLSDYECTVYNTIRQRWVSTRNFSCLHTPKQECLMIYLDGYEAVYTLKDGKKIRVPDNSVVYTATGSEYKVEFFDTFAKKDPHTTSIRFHLLKEGERVRLEEDFLFVQANASLKTLFEKGNLLHQRLSTISAEYKSLLFAILTEIGKIQKSKLINDSFVCIEYGFEYLNEHYNEDCSVEYLAKCCYVSPVWFRKIFKQYTGMSPSEYKIELRLTQACNYLKYSNMSVREISETVGYSDISLFIRLFKKKYSSTPLQFRKVHQPPQTVLV